MEGRETDSAHSGLLKHGWTSVTGSTALRVAISLVPMFPDKCFITGIMTASCWPILEIKSVAILKLIHAPVSLDDMDGSLFLDKVVLRCSVVLCNDK